MEKIDVWKRRYQKILADIREAAGLDIIPIVELVRGSVPADVQDMVQDRIFENLMWRINRISSSLGDVPESEADLDGTRWMSWQEEFRSRCRGLLREKIGRTAKHELSSLLEGLEENCPSNIFDEVRKRARRFLNYIESLASAFDTDKSGEVMIKKLIILANRLDRVGFKKEADFIDLLAKICVAEDDIEDGTIEDVRKMMEGWDTDHTPNFPKLRNNSPYRPSQFKLENADIWYTYHTSYYDERDREVKLPDTMETMYKLESLDQKPNMSALIAFPEGLDFILDFESGTSVMKSESHDADGKSPDYYDVIGDVSGESVREPGTLVTNEEFNSYAREHKFNVWGN